MVVLFVLLTFLLFFLLDLVASRAKARRTAQARDIRFVPDLGFCMADGGEPAEKITKPHVGQVKA